MKKGLIFSLMMAFLVWTASSLAWYPEQEKDGIKDTASPEEAKKLMEQGTYGMRKDYDPKPGWPWHEDIEKGNLKAEQIMYHADHNKENYGFYSHLWWRASIFLNSRGRYSGSSGHVYRYFDFNEGLPIGQDNYADVMNYNEGKIKAGDLFRRAMINWYYPPNSKGRNTLEMFYLKTPAVYKEPDRWLYLPGRRKVIRLGAASKAQLRGSGIATYDDTGGRTIWEHDHKIIGTDVLKIDDLWFGKNGYWDSPASTKTKIYFNKPIECWVILSKPRDPGYYLGQYITWVSKSEHPEHIHEVRLEQYDRAMNLWKIWESLYASEPLEDGEYPKLCSETWDLRRDFRDEVVYMDGLYPKHNNIPWKGEERKRYFFSLDNLKSEQFAWEIPDTNLRRKRFDVWRNTNPSHLMRDRFTEHRKIELMKEIEEKVKKLVEKGIFE